MNADRHGTHPLMKASRDRDDDERQRAVEALRDAAGALFAGLMEPSAGDRSLVVTATTNHGFVGYTMPLASPTASTAAYASGEPLFVVDVDNHRWADPRLVAASGAASLLFEPVLAAGLVRGIVVVGWATPQRDTDLELRGIVEQAATTIGDLLSEPAADAPDAEHVTDAVERAMALARRGETSLCIATLSLGPLPRESPGAEDRALVDRCAAEWPGHVRPGDTVHRLGPTELAVLLHDCRPDDARATAARLGASSPRPGGWTVAATRWDGRERAGALLARARRVTRAAQGTARRAALREPARLHALYRIGLLDAEPSPRLDALVRAASTALDAPVAYLSLVTADRQVFAAQHGIDAADPDVRGTPISRSFCQHVVASRTPFLVEDARDEPLIAGTPAVILGLVAYAGVPVCDSEGHVLGALCVVDRTPRQWSPEDVRVLEDLAAEALQPVDDRLEQALTQP